MQSKCQNIKLMAHRPLNEIQNEDADRFVLNKHWMLI